MKKMILMGVCLLLAGASPAIAACDCDTDSQVQRWVQENKKAARDLVRGWVHGVPLNELAKNAAVILGNRMYILSKCKDDTDFLEKNLLLGSGTESSGLEVLPSIIIEKKTGENFFSPIPLFEDQN